MMNNQVIQVEQVPQATSERMQVEAEALQALEGTKGWDVLMSWIATRMQSVKDTLGGGMRTVEVQNQDGSRTIHDRIQAQDELVGQITALNDLITGIERVKMGPALLARAIQEGRAVITRDEGIAPTAPEAPVAPAATTTSSTEPAPVAPVEPAAQAPETPAQSTTPEAAPTESAPVAS